MTHLEVLTNFLNIPVIYLQLSFCVSQENLFIPLSYTLCLLLTGGLVYIFHPNKFMDVRGWQIDSHVVNIKICELQLVIGDKYIND